MQVRRLGDDLLYLAFGLVLFFLAVRRRHHALFLAGGIGMGVAAIELAQTIDIALEAKLAAGGAILLAGTWLAVTFTTVMAGGAIDHAHFRQLLTALERTWPLFGTGCRRRGRRWA